jgi:hypothetical protein
MSDTLDRKPRVALTSDGLPVGIFEDDAEALRYAAENGIWPFRITPME